MCRHPRNSQKTFEDSPGTRGRVLMPNNSSSKVLVAFSVFVFALSLCVLSAPFSGATSSSSASLQAAIPRVPGSSSSQMPSFSCSSTTPCPMGVTDFGTNKGTTYNYKATTFQSWANFTALSLPTSPIGCINPSASKVHDRPAKPRGLQRLREGLGKADRGRVTRVQDVPVIAQVSGGYIINQLDNIWNFSKSGSQPTTMNGAIFPNLVSKCAQFGIEQSGADTLYLCEGNLQFSVTLPFEIRMTTTSGVLGSGTHKGSSYVELGIFVYHSGKLVGGDNFDEVAFNGAASSNPYYFVNGKGVNPFGTAIDAETVLCGPGGGSTIAISSVKATLSESYTPLGSNALHKDFPRVVRGVRHRGNCLQGVHVEHGGRNWNRILRL